MSNGGKGGHRHDNNIGCCCHRFCKGKCVSSCLEKLNFVVSTIRQSGVKSGVSSEEEEEAAAEKNCAQYWRLVGGTLSQHVNVRLKGATKRRRRRRRRRLLQQRSVGGDVDSESIKNNDQQQYDGDDDVSEE